MTESSTPAPSLKIRIRVDTAPSIEEAPATLDMRRVLTALGALVLILAAAFGMRGVLKKNSPEPVPTPLAEVTALPVSAPPPAEEIKKSSPAPVVTPVPRKLATPSTAPAATTRTQASAPDPTNRVVRAVLTDTPRKRQPVQALAGDLPVSDITKRFYFFTEIHDVASRRLTHRWEYRGKAVAQIRFSPSGKNWTGSSSKQIPTHMQGAWRAVLVDEHGTELSSVAFTYGKELTAAQN